MLLFTRDEELAKLLVGRSSRKVQVLENFAELREIVGDRREDAIVIDCDDHIDGLNALKATKQSAANGTSPTIAITNSETAHVDARDQGAWLSIEKTALWKRPEQIEAWLASVRRREYQRFQSEQPATIDSGGVQRRQV